MNTNEKPDRETLERWHKDPANWVLGIFYFNPKDKRLLPPKRISAMGWTVNFANPYSVLLLVGIIILVSCIAFIAKMVKNQ